MALLIHCFCMMHGFLYLYLTAVTAVQFGFFSFLLVLSLLLPFSAACACHVGFSQGKNCASVNNSNGTNGNANSTQKKTCPYCFQKLSWHALSRHVRDMHKNKSGVVTCKFCGKMFRNKNSLGCHVWRFHKTKQDGSGKHQQDSSGGQLLSNDHQSMETVKQEASE